MDLNEKYKYSPQFICNEYDYFSIYGTNMKGILDVWLWPTLKWTE